MEGKVRKFFPGGNTANGSHPMFNYMIPENVQRIFCLKGGPGVGKSSMMKAIAKEFIDKGYDVELHYCPSDPSSLDGVVIKKLGVVLLDGTAPHIVDPKDPGAIDEIINFGDYWELENLERNKEDIVACGHDINSSFKRAYKFLKAAEPIYYDIEEKNKRCMDFGLVNILTEQVSKTIFDEVENKEVYKKPRHLFGTAITPIGHVDYADSILNEAKKIYHLNGDIGSGKTTLLKSLYEKAVRKGLSVEVYHYPLLPHKIETIYIKDINVGVTTSDIFKESESIDLSQYLDNKKLEIYKDEVEFDKEVLNKLIEYAIENLKKAKDKHDIIENYYIPNMNFDKISDLKLDIINRIYKYENK